jgi:hypothetical protein
MERQKIYKKGFHQRWKGKKFVKRVSISDGKAKIYFGHDDNKNGSITFCVGNSKSWKDSIFVTAGQ